MRFAFVWICFAFSIMVMVASCGKNREEPSVTPPVTEPVDSTPVVTEPADTTLPANWVRAKTPNDTTYLIDIFFAGNTTGYAVGKDGEVWKSADGGLNWSAVYQEPDKTPFYNLAVTPNGSVYIVMTGVTKGIYTSADGVTFQYREVGNIYTSPDVYFTGNDTGYISAAAVSGSSSTGVWQTTNGGTSWQFIPIDSTRANSQTNDFAFYNSAQGYLLSNTNVFHTTGQNNGWSAPVRVSSSLLCTISAPSLTIAYAADYAGNIYKTTDGGATFAQTGSIQVAGAPSYINLRFVSETTGYATNGGVLHKTTDGGITWQKVLSLGSRLSEVHFTDANHGWVCGGNGTVLVYKP